LPEKEPLSGSTCLSHKHIFLMRLLKQCWCLSPALVSLLSDIAPRCCVLQSIEVTDLHTNNHALYHYYPPPPSLPPSLPPSATHTHTPIRSLKTATHSCRSHTNPSPKPQTTNAQPHQVTCLTAFDKVPRYVATLSGAERIRCVALKLWGVRCDQTDSIVTLEKARADRKKEPFVCEVIDTTCPGAVVTQVCVCV
jgi:hypothetical protein